MGITLECPYFEKTDSAVDQTRIYSALRVSSFPKAMYMKLSEGLHMWEPGQRQTGVLFRAFPWVPTRDSDCLDWWFGMSSGSEGTIIHRGQGHRWTAFLTTLLRLVILLGPHPPCHHYITLTTLDTFGYLIRGFVNTTKNLKKQKPFIETYITNRHKDVWKAHKVSHKICSTIYAVRFD